VNRVGQVCAAGAVILAMTAGGIFLSAQTTAIPEPRRGFGASVTPAFEGWFYNDDGSRGFLVGYYNRNSQQELDIPVGPNNRIEPGGPDLGQPTHFLPGRQWGMFVVPVPKDFKPTDSYVWTIVANGQTTSIPLRLTPDYVMRPFSEIAVGNTPPAIRFDQAAPPLQGPAAAMTNATARTASLAAPFPLTVWAADDMKYTSGSNAPPAAARQPVSVRVSQFRGAGKVTFDKPRPDFEKLPAGAAAFNGRAIANVKFSEPGDYVLHITANDYSGDGGGGFGCCWTTALVKVAVKP
jgi:hypothetical protein